MSAGNYTSYPAPSLSRFQPPEDAPSFDSDDLMSLIRSLGPTDAELADANTMLASIIAGVRSDATREVIRSLMAEGKL